MIGEKKKYTREERVLSSVRYTFHQHDVLKEHLKKYPSLKPLFDARKAEYDFLQRLIRGIEDRPGSTFDAVPWEKWNQNVRNIFTLSAFYFYRSYLDELIELLDFLSVYDIDREKDTVVFEYGEEKVGFRVTTFQKDPYIFADKIGRAHV